MDNRDEKRKPVRATIVTIYDPSPNCGNRLQNYAVQTVLNDLGCSVDTLSFEKPMMSGMEKAKALAQKLSGYRLPGDASYWRLLPARIRAFESFNRRCIATQTIRSVSQIKPADYYVLGSDQVWNAAWYNVKGNELRKELFLLTFAKPEQKVCFAPSFGIEKLPAEWEPWFRKYLSDFPRLSVRENAGAAVIKELTGRDAFVMIDPTLMLDRNQWDEIAAKPAGVDTEKPYILTYFLGGRSAEREQTIQDCAARLHAAVYHLADPAQPELYVTGPSEFLYLIAHAELVLTDSFHACVFSFLYGKPFLVYDRQQGGGMMSRMETFLKTFGLARKYAGSGLENQLLECDYRAGVRTLAAERTNALHFLRASMQMEAE